MLNKNTIKYGSIKSLLSTEYNDKLIVRKNRIEVSHLNSERLRLQSEMSNHYSYPPQTYSESIYESNLFLISGWDGGSIDISNSYDFPISFKSNNKIKKNGVSSNIKLYNNGHNK